MYPFAGVIGQRTHFLSLKSIYGQKDFILPQEVNKTNRKPFLPTLPSFVQIGSRRDSTCRMQYFRRNAFLSQLPECDFEYLCNQHSNSGTGLACNWDTCFSGWQFLSLVRHQVHWIGQCIYEQPLQPKCLDRRSCMQVQLEITQRDWLKRDPEAYELAIKQVMEVRRIASESVSANLQCRRCWLGSCQLDRLWSARSNPVELCTPCAGQVFSMPVADLDDGNRIAPARVAKVFMG